MSSARIIVDAGPIVAVLDRRDRFHEWAVEQFKLLGDPVATCEPVLTECFFLLRHVPTGHSRLFDLLDKGAITFPFRLENELQAMRILMEKYTQVPMSLADACLVRMVEQNPGARVFTIDSDFRIYRQAGRRQIPLIIPDGR